MQAPWIAVARPRNWRSALVIAASVLVWGMLGLICLLVGLPELTLLGVWVDPVWLRVALLCVWYLAARSCVPLALSLLNSAPWLWGDRVRVQVRGRRFRIHVRDIERVRIELRPRGEIAVMQLRTGVSVDLCPLGWPGAAPLVSKLRRAVARAQGRQRASRS